MEFVRYINFPKIPSVIINNLPKDINQYKSILDLGNYTNSNTYNEEIMEFCSNNICPGVEWRQQFITGDLIKHIDYGVTSKFLYIYEQGGDNVITRFWDDSKQILLKEYHIACNRWIIMKVDTYHSVHNIDIGKIRRAIVGWIFSSKKDYI